MSAPTETIRQMEAGYDDFLQSLNEKDWEKAEAIIVNMVDYSLSLTREMREELAEAKVKAKEAKEV